MSADVSRRTPGQLRAGSISDQSGWMGLYAGDREQSVGYLTPLRNGTPDERGDAETQANATYMVEAWNNYDRVLRERDALAKVLRICRATLPHMGGNLMSTHTLCADIDRALASLERKEG